ncbi:MAG: hypothetical protein LBE15_00030, partial [Burkholderiales bacterium]|nr:hypothetical protein [Burkholderiales bacterium]
MKKTGLLLVLLFSFGLVWAEEGLPTIKELEWCLDVDFKESACVRFKQALEKACNANNGVACNRLGEVHANNRNGFNLSEVAPYFEKACAARVIEGCLNLGIWYYYSREPV